MMKHAITAIVLIISATTAFAGVHWSYSGEDGPEHWGELSPDFSLCKDGVNQSPIDLVAELDVELPELSFQYHGTPLQEINNGHTIQVNVMSGNYLDVPESGWKSELLQAHFHSPSEHLINGNSFDMEIHLVHTDEEGHLTVVGVMIEEGEENPLLSRIWAFMPENAGDTTESPLTVFEAGVLPPTRNYFTYNGSLTTPPCSEGVRWLVLIDPITASPEQIARFKNKMGKTTNRPIQEHNARIILN
jgi:carbonic anhydrase